MGHAGGAQQQQQHLSWYLLAAGWVRDKISTTTRPEAGRCKTRVRLAPVKLAKPHSSTTQHHQTYVCHLHLLAATATTCTTTCSKRVTACAPSQTVCHHVDAAGPQRERELMGADGRSSSTVAWLEDATHCALEAGQHVMALDAMVVLV